MTLPELAAGKCVPLSGPAHRLDAARSTRLLRLLPGWEDAGNEIAKTYRFSDYAETLDFVTEVAALARREDHHPEINFGYNRCRVAWSTHSVGGLSTNDFICAAKIEALLQA
jgi:4a-hydroxytetrahydrobiopterin dehydratase